MIFTHSRIVLLNKSTDAKNHKEYNGASEHSDYRFNAAALKIHLWF